MSSCVVGTVSVVSLLVRGPNHITELNYCQELFEDPAEGVSLWGLGDFNLAFTAEAQRATAGFAEESFRSRAMS